MDLHMLLDNLSLVLFKIYQEKRSNASRTYITNEYCLTHRFTLLFQRFQFQRLYSFAKYENICSISKYRVQIFVPYICTSLTSLDKVHSFANCPQLQKVHFLALTGIINSFQFQRLYSFAKFENIYSISKYRVLIIRIDVGMQPMTFNSNRNQLVQQINKTFLFFISLRLKHTQSPNRFGVLTINEKSFCF